ncbi:hypothetical protein TcWFU_004700 [Taenia crassiceps]|uniref:Uncharacterized protein n=1 Tax=Taenia crassiceps TaxID=6207 RepID=A0ABR4QKV8_9CEST
MQKARYPVIYHVGFNDYLAVPSRLQGRGEEGMGRCGGGNFAATPVDPFVPLPPLLVAHVSVPPPTGFDSRRSDPFFSSAVAT